MSTEYEYVTDMCGDGETTHRWTDDNGDTIDLDLFPDGSAIAITWDGDQCQFDLPALRILRDVLTAHIARHTGNEKP